MLPLQLVAAVLVAGVPLDLEGAARLRDHGLVDPRRGLLRRRVPQGRPPELQEVRIALALVEHAPQRRRVERDGGVLLGERSHERIRRGVLVEQADADLFRAVPERRGHPVEVQRQAGSARQHQQEGRGRRRGLAALSNARPTAKSSVCASSSRTTRGR